MLLSLKPQPSFFLRPKLLLSRHSSSAVSSAASIRAAKMSTSVATTIEHIVLFKVRPAVDPSNMISSLNGLASLPAVSHMSAGPVLRLRSAAANDFGFTHILHSRYESKEKLLSYANDPAHLSVVKELVLPSCEDIMAVDWIGSGLIPGPIAPGSVARLTLTKLKEGSDPSELTSVLASAKEAIPGTTLLTYGENFCARAKGYSFGMIAVFPKVEDLEKLDGAHLETFKEKVRPILDGLVVLDFVVSDPAQSSANL